jgi:hypothetical protein
MLLLAAGQLARIALEEFLRVQRHHGHQFGGALVAALLVPAQQARDDGDVFLDGHVGNRPICWIT